MLNALNEYPRKVSPVDQGQQQEQNLQHNLWYLTLKMDLAFEISQEQLHIYNAKIKQALQISKYKHMIARERERERENLV